MYHKMEETDFCWISYGRNGGPVDREGCGVPQNRGNRLVLECYGRNGGPVHREGCGVPQNGTPWDTVHLHRRPPPASTGYCSSTVDLLQPPPATVQPRAPVHPASTARYSTGYCSTTRLLFIQPSTPRGPVQPPLHGHPSTVYCSSSPPRGRPIHPALHGVLFIQPQPARSIGVLFIQRQRPLLPRGPVHTTPHRELFIHPPPPATLTVHPEAASIGFS